VSGHERMSWETFGENRPASVAEIRAMLANPKSRKRFNLIELYEKETGELLAEVFRTSRGAVVVYRGIEGWDQPFSIRDNPEDEARYDSFRQLRGAPAVLPLTGDPEQLFSIAPRTAMPYVLPARDFCEGEGGSAVSRCASR
jgi:hypothetical protein